MPVLPRRKPKPSPPASRRAQDGRTYRQIENYYKQHGYYPPNIEQLAEEDLQLVQALQGRRKRPLKLTGEEN